MATRPSEADIELRIHNLISAAQDRLFEQFDDLHKREIHDNDVIGVLRKSGYTELADSYAEWADIVVDVEEDNTTTNPDAVTDPGDAPSYALLNRALKDQTPGVGVTEMNLRLLRENLPVGSKVRYRPSPGVFPATYLTTGEVYVSAGTAVVALGNGPNAAAVHCLERLA